jgi:hypothetical protein
MNVFEKLTNCAYMPDIDFPERTDPDYQSKRAEWDAAEAVGVAQLKADLLAQHGLTTSERASKAFDVIYKREGVVGLYAVVDLFEDMLPLIVEVN